MQLKITLLVNFLVEGFIKLVLKLFTNDTLYVLKEPAENVRIKA